VPSIYVLVAKRHAAVTEPEAEAEAELEPATA